MNDRYKGTERGMMELTGRKATAILFLVFYLIALGSAWGGLREAWKGLLKYKSEERNCYEEKTLAQVWAQLLARYPYPEKVMRKGRITPQDLLQVPTFYKRPWGKLRPELLMAKVAPWKRWIDEASRLFNVPKAIVAAVIIQESGGNPKARARDTSAKGLMQTIDATFALAKRNLAHIGIEINDPLEPRDSILAGTWYLSRCFEMAKRDLGLKVNRSKIGHWRWALEYYYAGPVWGKNPKPILYIERRGKVVKIHKAQYSSGVLRYAEAIGREV